MSNELHEGAFDMKGVIHVDYRKLEGSLAKKLLLFFREMPIPQGIIVLTVLGITTGTMMAGGYEIIEKVAKILSYISSFGLGITSLWMLNSSICCDKDTYKFSRILNYVVLLLMISNLFQIFDYNQSTYFVVLNMASILLMVFIFLISLKLFVHKKF